MIRFFAAKMYYTFLSLSVLVSTLVASVFSVYLYFKHSYSYWKQRNVPFVKPKTPFGNIHPPWRKRDIFGNTIRSWYEELKPSGNKLGGSYIFTAPVLVLLDPGLIKDILIKNFDHFTDQGVYYNEKDEPLSAHLLNVEGQRWKNMRSKLSPTFTSGKMRLMFPALVKYSEQIQEVLIQHDKTKQPVDFKDTFLRYTTNVVCSLAFGIDSDCFKNQNPEITRYGKMVFEASSFAEFQGIFAFTYPKTARALGIKVYAPGVEKFFTDLIAGALEYRRSNPGDWVDLMQTMIDLTQDETSGISRTDVISNAFVFFQGYETSATTGAFLMYELCENLDVQERLREEINEVLGRHGGKLTYEAMKEMKYMDMVINGKESCVSLTKNTSISLLETLRKYPPFQFLTRMCTKSYKVPGEDLVIEKGTKLFISNLGIQNDPQYFPNPEKFDPERFSPENQDKLTPYTNLPFGNGPRICIGKWFWLLL